MKKAILATIYTILEIGFYSEAMAEDDKPAMLKSTQPNQINKNIYQQYYTGDHNYYPPSYYNQTYYPYEHEPAASYRGNSKTAVNNEPSSSRTGVSYYYQ